MRSQLESGLWGAVKDTWADDVIKHRFPNIRFYGYCAMSKDEKHQSPHDTLGYIGVDEKLVLLPQDDDLFSQFDRTRATMRTLIQHLRDADYVLFTNCSTYINVPLLNDFVQSLSEQDLRIYCGRVISAQYMSGPYSWCFYGEGSAILLRQPWINYLLQNQWRKHVIENNHVNGEKQWLFYKRNVTDTAIACIVNDLLLSNDAADCLKILDIDESNIQSKKLDHTLFWQDWGQDHMREEEPEVWSVMGSIDCRDKTDALTAKNLHTVHDKVKEYYIENDYQTDMRYIDSYVDNPQTPVVTKSLDKPDCCIDDYEKVPFDDYHKWLEENSDIPNLEVNEDGNLVEVHENDRKKKQSYYDQWGQEIPAGMTYAEYFNIPFWDHRCWYKHPWAGDNFCGCCQREQLVYPGGSPTHEHDGSEDCDCHKKHQGDGGSGSGCFDWDVI